MEPITQTELLLAAETYRQADERRRQDCTAHLEKVRAQNPRVNLPYLAEQFYEQNTLEAYVEDVVVDYVKIAKQIRKVISK